MAHPREVEVERGDQRRADGVGVVVEGAVDLRRRRARRDRAPRLEGQLVDAGSLPPGIPGELAERADVEQRAIERHGRLVAAIVAGHRDGVGEAARREHQRVHPGRDLATPARDRETQRLVPLRQHQLAEPGVVAGVLRIGVEHAPLVLRLRGFLVQPAGEPLDAARHAGIAARTAGREQAAVARVVGAAVLQAGAGREARVVAQQVDRVERRHRHDAADRGAAVARRRRPLEDLDASHEIEIGERAAGAGEVADRERRGARHAVDLQPHAIAADAADRDRVVAETRGVTAHGEAGLASRNVAQVERQRVLEPRRVDDADAGLGRDQRTRHAAEDGHGLERLVGRRVAWRGLRARDGAEDRAGDRAGDRERRGAARRAGESRRAAELRCHRRIVRSGSAAPARGDCV